MKTKIRVNQKRFRLNNLGYFTDFKIGKNIWKSAWYLHAELFHGYNSKFFEIYDFRSVKIKIWNDIVYLIYGKQSLLYLFFTLYTKNQK